MEDINMDYNKDKVDDMTLALLHLVMFDDKYGTRAWKGFDWDTMNRLHEKGYISEPKGKAKSVIVTEEGSKRAEELFKKFFQDEEEID
jgi:hypothetical protein